MTGWTDVIKAVAPSVISGGVTLYGGAKAREANSNAAEQNAALAQRAAEFIKQGYDEQTAFLLAGLNDLNAWTDAGYEATTGGLAGVQAAYAGGMAAGDDAYADTLGEGYAGYSDAMGAAVDGYAGGMYGASGQFGDAIVGNAEDYAEELLPAAYQYGDNLFAGQGAAMEYLDPYVGQGNAALAELAATMGLDPNELTPEQQIMLRDFRDSQGATLAASDLRGAGAAGVGAMMRSEADLRAKLHAQNQQRKDRAVASLAQMGYGASGTGANMTMGNATRAAGTVYDATGRGLSAVKAAGDQAAQNQFTTAADVARTGLVTAGDVAKTGLNTAQTIAGQRLTSDRDVNKTALGIGKEAVNNTTGYFGSKGQIAANRSQILGGNAMGKANADASAATSGGQGILQAGINNANVWGQSLGQLAQVIASSAKQARSGGNPTTITIG